MKHDVGPLALGGVRPRVAGRSLLASGEAERHDRAFPRGAVVGWHNEVLELYPVSLAIVREFDGFLERAEYLVFHLPIRLASRYPLRNFARDRESRVAGSYRQYAEERAITVRVDCANAPPVGVTRKVNLELNKIEWFPAPEISPST